MIRVRRTIATKPGSAIVLIVLSMVMGVLLAACGDVAGAAPLGEEPTAAEEAAPAAEPETEPVTIDFGDVNVAGMDEYPTTPEECICGDDALKLLEQLNEERARKAAVE